MIFKKFTFHMCHLLSRLPKTNLGYIATVVCDLDVTRWSGIRRLDYFPIAPIACFRMKLYWSIKRLCSASSKVAAQSTRQQHRICCRSENANREPDNESVTSLRRWGCAASTCVACGSSSNSSFTFVHPSECRTLRLLPDTSQTDPLSKKDENNRCFAL